MTKGKRAKMPRVVDYSKLFIKDWHRLNKAGRNNMNDLKKAMLLLIADDEALPQEYKDHALSGNLKDFRECHIGGDFLLIYQLFGNGSVIVFSRAGTHSELFE